MDPQPRKMSKVATVSSPEPTRKRGEPGPLDRCEGVGEPVERVGGRGWRQIGPEPQADGGSRRQSMRLTGAVAAQASCEKMKVDHSPESQMAMMQNLEKRVRDCALVALQSGV